MTERTERTVTFTAENLGVTTGTVALKKANASTNVGEGYKWNIGLEFNSSMPKRNAIANCRVMEHYILNTDCDVTAEEIAQRREIQIEDVGNLTYAQIEDSLVEIAVVKSFMSVFGKIPANVSFAR